MAAASLIAYSVGLLGFILVKVLSTGYFSRQSTRAPVRIGVMALVLNMGLNIIFVVTLVRVDFFAPHVGLALATTISALFNALLLYRGLRRDGVYVPHPGWGRFAIQVAVASSLMSGAVLWARNQAGDWLALSAFERLGALAACVAGGMIVYFLACYLAGLTPASLRGQRPQTQP